MLQLTSMASARVSVAAVTGRTVPVVTVPLTVRVSAPSEIVSTVGVSVKLAVPLN